MTHKNPDLRPDANVILKDEYFQDKDKVSLLWSCDCYDLVIAMT